MKNAHASSKQNRRPPSPEAIEIAVAWDALPAVAQEYVREIIDAVRRLQTEDALLASRLLSRADPKRARAHERKIERYQRLKRAER